MCVCVCVCVCVLPLSVAQGLPAGRARQQAKAALDSGARGVDLEIIASVGSQGENPQNDERDLLNRLEDLVDVPVKPYSIQVPKLVKKTGKVRVTTACIIPAHRVLAEVHKLGPVVFTEMFGERKDWARYWHAHRDEIWLKEHVHYEEIRRNPTAWCPYLIFGDDAQTSKRVGRTCRLLMWFSPVTKIRSFHSHVPLLIVDNDEATIDGMVHRLHRAAVWSFKFAGRNLNPFLNEDNAQLPEDLARLSGQPLVDGEPVFLVHSGGCIAGRSHDPLRPSLQPSEVGQVLHPDGFQWTNGRLEMEARRVRAPIPLQLSFDL